MTRPFSVVTLNIRNGRAYDGANSWPFRRRWVPEYLRSLDADVIGLQEAYHNQVVAVEKALPGYVRVGVGRDDGRKAGEFCPIYVRTSRFKLVEHGTFWFSDTPEVPGSCTWGNTLPRICTWALLAEAEAEPRAAAGLAAGCLLRVGNLHLDHASADARVRSVDLLRERIAAWRRMAPVVVMGDFNADEQDPLITTLLTGPDGLRDTYRILHPDGRRAGTFHAWEGRTDGPRIDYILTTPDVTTLDASILTDSIGGRLPSDHWPVMARLQVGNP